METESSKDLSPQQKYSLLREQARERGLTHRDLLNLNLATLKEGTPLTDKDLEENINKLRARLK